MRMRVFAFAVAAAAVMELSSHAAAAPACTMMFTYPSPIGRQTFMVATATTATVTAPVAIEPLRRAKECVACLAIRFAWRATAEKANAAAEGVVS